MLRLLGIAAVVLTVGLLIVWDTLKKMADTALDQQDAARTRNVAFFFILLGIMALGLGAVLYCRLAMGYRSLRHRGAQSEPFGARHFQLQPALPRPVLRRRDRAELQLLQRLRSADGAVRRE